MAESIPNRLLRRGRYPHRFEGEKGSDENLPVGLDKLQVLVMEGPLDELSQVRVDHSKGTWLQKFEGRRGQHAAKINPNTGKLSAAKPLHTQQSKMDKHSKTQFTLGRGESSHPSSRKMRAHGKIHFPPPPFLAGPKCSRYYTSRRLGFKKHLS